MRTDFERCHVTQRGAVAVLTLNHPETVNAASFSMMQGCLRAMDLIEATPTFRALVFTGEGRGFCSGANLAEPPPGAADLGEVLEKTYHPLLRRLRDTHLPIVTALNGPAAGVGVSLALMGDLVIAARSAFLAVGFTRLGLVPDGGSTWLLPRLVGLARARELAHAAIASAEKQAEGGEPISLLICDIDHFKKFNDTWGHQTGDQVLKVVAGCLSENIKGRDLAARYGGEEFGLVLRGATLEGAVLVAEQIRQSVEGHRLVKKSTGDVLGTMTISIGVAQFGPHEKAEAVVRRADACLYGAKRNGRNLVIAENDPRMAANAA